MLWNKHKLLVKEFNMDMEVQDAMMKDKASRDKLASAVAPKGKFGASAMNKLVASMNRLIPMFGLEGSMPDFQATVTEFPAELVNLLSAIRQATMDFGEEDYMFDLASIKKDTDILLLAAQLGELAKDREFKRFLAEPMPMNEDMQGQPAMGQAAPAGPTEDELMKLLMNRGV